MMRAICKFATSRTRTWQISARPARQPTTSARHRLPRARSGQRSFRACRHSCAQALAVFYALGGPRLETADELADRAYSLTTQPIEMLQLANNSLGELKRLTDRDEKLRLA
jgi:hypothetical protein